MEHEPLSLSSDRAQRIEMGVSTKPEVAFEEPTSPSADHHAFDDDGRDASTASDESTHRDSRGHPPSRAVTGHFLHRMGLNARLEVFRDQPGLD